MAERKDIEYSQYLPILEKYARHADSEIREWAQEAITEIEYRVAYASASQETR
jgi:hypothetical protein